MACTRLVHCNAYHYKLKRIICIYGKENLEVALLRIATLDIRGSF
jgi:hypothetical protein